jgi:2-polyprenyl-3-methyl-5-hydroxy-6-metoxy-1,4-benzoquinol methylase
MMDTCVVCRQSETSFEPFWSNLARCPRCGHCMADLDPGKLDFTRIYADSYFCGEEYDDYLKDKKIFERQFKDRLRQVMTFKNAGNLVEIGCAYGFFLQLARRFFTVRGFDISAGPVAYARDHLGLDAKCEDFNERALPPESVDVIVMWDTIEHLPRPDITVDAAWRALKPDGVLLLTTGDIGSVLARIRREKWRLIHPPTHLHYFSPRTISEFLRKAGFQVVTIKHVGTRRSLRQVAFSLLQLNRRRPSRLYRLIAGSRLAELSFVLNTYDIMFVAARKTPLFRSGA